MIFFNSFNFSRLIYMIFIISTFSLIEFKKISVLLFISFLLILIGFLKKFWRLAKQSQLKVATAPLSCYFIVSMLISYNHFYASNCTNNFCSDDVLVSVNRNINDPSINIFDKNFDFSFYNSSRLSYEVMKYQKINMLTPKGSSNSHNLNTLSFLHISAFF